MKPIDFKPESEFNYQPNDNTNDNKKFTKDVSAEIDKQFNKKITKDAISVIKKEASQPIAVKRDSISPSSGFDNSFDYTASLETMIRSVAEEFPDLVKQDEPELQEKPKPSPGLGDSDDSWMP